MYLSWVIFQKNHPWSVLAFSCCTNQNILPNMESSSVCLIYSRLYVSYAQYTSLLSQKKSEQSLCYLVVKQRVWLPYVLLFAACQTTNRSNKNTYVGIKHIFCWLRTPTYHWALRLPGFQVPIWNSEWQISWIMLFKSLRTPTYHWALRLLLWNETRASQSFV